MRTLANSEDPDEMLQKCSISSGSTLFARAKTISRERNTIFIKEYITCDPLIFTMDQSKINLSNRKEESICA